MNIPRVITGIPNMLLTQLTRGAQELLKGKLHEAGDEILGLFHILDTPFWLLERNGTEKIFNANRVTQGPEFYSAVVNQRQYAKL